MSQKIRKNRIAYLLQFWPFSRYSVLWGILFWVAYKILHHSPKKENALDAQIPFMNLMGSFVAWLLLILLTLSLLSSIASWLYFIILQQNNKTKLEVKFITEGKSEQKKQFLEALLPAAFRPMLGFVKARLVYDNNQLSDKFNFVSARRKPNSILRNALLGKSRIALPDIKEYQITGSIVFFEDMLQILSLPMKMPLSGNFYQAPDTLLQGVDDVAPKKTDTMDIRIDQLRKVEGEYLNYKDFESGDDVRRIVWKVFAKNRDLVVRMPERMEPYASHLYFYASFYNSFNTLFTGNEYFAEMLNFYKTNVWSIYTQLQEKEWQIKYIPDQQFHLAEQLSEQEKDERIISNSEWQNHTSTRSYFSPKKGTVLVVSSLTDPKELAQLLDECDASVQIIYVKLSTYFKQYVALHWLKNLFIISAPDRLSKLKSRWIFSPLRRQLLHKEKEIEMLLSSPL